MAADIAAQILAKTGPSHFVPIDAAVIAAQQGLIDIFAGSGVIPVRLDAAQVFDRRFNAVVQQSAQEGNP